MTSHPSLLVDAAADHDGARHRGVLAGRCLAAVRDVADPRVPPTSVDVRFGPSPRTGSRPRPATVQQVDALRFTVMLPDGDEPAAEAVVELAGHDVGPRSPDLAELGTWRLPPIEAAPTSEGCWGCGDGGVLQCRPAGSDLALATWAADERAGEGDHVDPAVAVAVLTCPTTWLADGVPPQRLVARFFGRAPAYEPLRVVARRDPPREDTVGVRVALVGDDGALLVVGATIHPAVSHPRRRGDGSRPR